MRTRHATLTPTGDRPEPEPTEAAVPMASPWAKRVPATRASRAWMRVLPAVVILAVTLVFVLQNSRSAKVAFLGASGRLPLGVALLAAAALGGLLVLALGSIRIAQLRRIIHRSPGAGHRGTGLETP